MENAYEHLSKADENHTGIANVPNVQKFSRNYGCKSYLQK